ncbi:MAG: sulfite exporter TauE/SafE family protein [bacterium]
MPYSHAFLAGLAILGAGVGYAAGLFGVGGGFMLTPLLISLFGIDPAVAVGSGLAQMIVVGAGSAWRHAKKHCTDTRLVLCMAPGTIIGTALGKGFLKYLEGIGSVSFLGRKAPFATTTVSAIFVVLLFGIAIHLWRENNSEQDNPSNRLCWPNGPLRIGLPASNVKAVSLFSLTMAGLLIGVLAGLLGIGGGVILIPLLVYGYGIHLRMAIGTSSLLIMVSAIAGTIQYALAGKVDLRIVFALMAGSLIGVQFGAWHSHRIHVAYLQRAFALLVIAIACICLVRIIWS